MSESVILAQLGDVAELVLNRPERRNALDAAAVTALGAALRQLESDPPRALLVRGEGKGFCAGRDLSDAEPLTEDGEAILSEMNPLIARLGPSRALRRSGRLRTSSAMSPFLSSRIASLIGPPLPSWPPS